jgi:4-amino-4-deoxy-L-arabinose transferase-like glycosyltransferase
VAAGLVALGLLVLLFRLGQGPLLDFDEATYAEIAREIGVFHDFVHLHFDFAPWFNKAPLYQWLTYLAYQVFGVGEFGARFVSALAGAATLGATYAVGRTWLGRPAAAAAALMLLLSNLFVRAARFGTSDVLLTLWIWAALYAYLRSRANPRWWLAVGAFCGLAFMTKDLASLVAPAAIGVAALYELRALLFRRPEPWLGLLLMAAIGLPWLLAMYAWQGQGFFNQFVGYMVVTRAESQIEGHTGGATFYAVWSGIGFYPWVFAAAAGFAQHVLVDLRLRRASIVLAAFTVILLALYTAARSKLYWYLDPVFPAYALFAAGGAQWLLSRRGLLPVAAAALVTGVALWAAPNSVRNLPSAAIAGFTFLLVVAAAFGLWRGGRVAPVLAAGALAFVVASAVTVAPLYDLPQQPGAALGKAARTATPVPLLLYVSSRARYPDDDISHSLTFYSRRPVTPVIGRDVLQSAVPCGRTVDAVLDQRDLPGLGAGYGWQPEAAWFQLEYGRLTRRC